MSQEAIMSVLLFEGQTPEERAGALAEAKERFEADKAKKGLDFTFESMLESIKKAWSERPDNTSREEFMFMLADGSHLPANYLDAMLYEAGIPTEA